MTIAILRDGLYYTMILQKLLFDSVDIDVLLINLSLYLHSILSCTYYAKNKTMKISN